MLTRTKTVTAVAMLTLCATAFTGCDDEENFDGLGMSLSTLPLLSDAKTRSISAENITGEKGMGGMATEGTGANAARELGQGWKISPSVRIGAGETEPSIEVPARDDPGARLAERGALPTPGGRHLIGGVLVSGGAACPVSGSTRQREPGDCEVSFPQVCTTT